MLLIEVVKPKPGSDSCNESIQKAVYSINRKGNLNA